MSIVQLTVQKLFAYGMRRDLPELRPVEFPCLELGPGRHPVFERNPSATVIDPFSYKLDWPGWDADRNPIPYPDASFRSIIAFHFFEHLDGKTVISVLRECERVLKVGGVLTVVVPHRLGSMAYHDLTHRSFWTEDCWSNLLGGADYDKDREGWNLKVHFNMIAGVVERNLCLMTQLVKMEATS